MKKEHVIRAWRDPEYRARLSEAERAQLPTHPAALIELGDAELGLAAAAAVIPPQTNTRSTAIGSYGCDCICCVAVDS
jgi:mersacidin/lichenicidin family type 2 lantibiotic